MTSGKGRHGRERARGSFLGCREGGERPSRVRFGPRWRMEWETEVPVHRTLYHVRRIQRHSCLAPWLVRSLRFSHFVCDNGHIAAATAAELVAHCACEMMDRDHERGRRVGEKLRAS